jgi:hypothetical protein
MKPWTTISLAALTAALTVAACGQAGGGQAAASGTAQAAEADPAAMPSMDHFAAPPAPETARPVQPLSNTAAAVTGAATFGQAAYHFALGQTYAVKVEQTVAADIPWSAKGRSWATLLGVDDGGEVVVVKVVSQAIDAARARNGSLCGGRRAVRWIATARSGEDVGAEVRMAAFSGERPPGPMGRDEDLCGTYNYAAGN